MISHHTLGFHLLLKKQEVWACETQGCRAGAGQAQSGVRSSDRRARSPSPQCPHLLETVTYLAVSRTESRHYIYFSPRFTSFLAAPSPDSQAQPCLSPPGLPPYTDGLKDSPLIPSHVHMLPIHANTPRRLAVSLPAAVSGIFAPSLWEELRAMLTSPEKSAAETSTGPRGRANPGEATGCGNDCWLHQGLQNPLISPAQPEHCSLTPSAHRTSGP